MFVLKTKLDEADAIARHWKNKYSEAVRRHNALNLKWNRLVGRINAKGGEDFLDNATIQQASPFSTDEIRKLLQLCHPDKHGDSRLATEMTQKLLAMKDSA